MNVIVTCGMGNDVVVSVHLLPGSDGTARSAFEGPNSRLDSGVLAGVGSLEKME